MRHKALILLALSVILQFKNFARAEIIDSLNVIRKQGNCTLMRYYHSGGFSEDIEQYWVCPNTGSSTTDVQGSIDLARINSNLSRRKIEALQESYRTQQRIDADHVEYEVFIDQQTPRFGAKNRQDWMKRSATIKIYDNEQRIFQNIVAFRVLPSVEMDIFSNAAGIGIWPTKNVSTVDNPVFITELPSVCRDKIAGNIPVKITMATIRHQTQVSCD